MTDYTFRLRKLDTVMRPLEDKRNAMAKRSCDDRVTTVRRNLRNSLEINMDFSISKVKKSKGEKSKVITSKEEDAGDAAWERYINALRPGRSIELATVKRCFTACKTMFCSLRIEYSPRRTQSSTEKIFYQRTV